MSDTTVTLTAIDNPAVTTTQSITVDKADVSNWGGSATVTYTGESFDLNAIAGLFTVDSHAGEPVASIETGGTGAGTISGSNLTVTKQAASISDLKRWRQQISRLAQRPQHC